MSFHSTILKLNTEKAIQLIEVTPHVQAFVEKTGVQQGLCVLATLHTTLAIVLNENCKALEKDILSFLDRFIPAQQNYHHDRLAVAEGDGRLNTHSHLLSICLPSQQTLSIQNGKIDLGTWQSLIAIELDGPRPDRKLKITVLSAE